MLGVPPTLEVTHAFGSLSSQLRRGAVHFGDESAEYLVYPVGRRLAFRRIDTGEANLVVESLRVEEVTACAISRDRCLVAVCERCATEPFTQVSVYDLREVRARPTQTLEELGGAVGRISCASFSHDEAASFLCLASEAPQNLLVLLDWRKNRVVARVELAGPADQVGVDPLDDNIVSASGEGLSLQLREANAGAFLEPPPIEGLDVRMTVVDHAWAHLLDGTIIVCMREGPLHVISSKDATLVKTIANPFEGVATARPLCVHCYPGGFLVGAEGGLVASWACSSSNKKTSEAEEVELCSHVRTACVRKRGAEAAVCSMDVAGSEGQTKIVFGFGNGDIGQLQMTALMLKGGGEDLTVSETLAGGFHGGPITSLDVASQRPIIASASRQEASVRIWNYSLRRCELSWKFTGHEVASVAIHPLGYLLAVGLSDKLKFFQVLVSELKLQRELSIRGIHMVKFSHGGHLLAVAAGKLVVVLSLRSFTKAATLRGHSQHVVSISFDPQDHFLLTCGEDGTLCEWSTLTWVKEREHFARSSDCLAVTSDNDGLACCSMLEGTKSMIHTLHHCTPHAEVLLPPPMRVTALCHHTVGAERAPVLLAGTANGSVWVTGEPNLPERRDEHGIHAGECTALCLTADARTVISAGADGAIFVLSAKGLDSGDEGSRWSADMGKSCAGEVVMMSKGEIFEEYQHLDAENGLLQGRLAEETAKLDGKCKEAVNEARQQDQKEIERLRQEYETLQQAATAKERESLRLMKAIEADHVAAADKLEADNNKRIMQEADRFVSVEAELKRLGRRLAVDREDSYAQILQVRHTMQEELRKLVAEKDVEIQKQKDLIAFSTHRFDTMLDQEGMEYNLEVSELKRRCEDELEQQRLIEYKLKKEQDTLLRGLDMMERERERISKEQDETRRTIETLTREKLELERVVTDMKAERRDRETALRQKELQIGEFKLKVNTLKKFKHVLDFKLREVSRSLQPKDHTISQLNSSLIELEAEFERALKMQHAMEHTSDQKTQQMKNLAAECEQLRDVISVRDRTIERFTADLHWLVTEERDIRKWPRGLKQIYRDHIKPDYVAQDDENALPLEELRRQTNSMERKVELLAARKGQAEGECRNDIKSKTYENSLLIRELEGLRVERKQLQRQVKDLELRVKQAETRLRSVMDVPKALSPAVPPALEASLPRSPSDPALQLQGDARGGTSAGRPVSTKTVWQPPLAGVTAKRRKRPHSHKLPEERRQLQQLLVTADLNDQQIKMQALENKILRDQVEKLSAERAHVAAVAGGSAHAAGSGRAARHEGP